MMYSDSLIPVNVILHHDPNIRYYATTKEQLDILLTEGACVWKQRFQIALSVTLACLSNTCPYFSNKDYTSLIFILNTFAFSVGTVLAYFFWKESRKEQGKANETYNKII
ncbi:hypothetical protein FACS1894216_16450 [Synergistales bacterium]|nr:hypothetical protein FACS1894216_16450 [Synergistales bacterium]